MKNTIRAFPHDYDGFGGMNLRDYFAAAVAGHLEAGARDNMDFRYWHPPERIAKRAYEIADAMMKARK